MITKKMIVAAIEGGMTPFDISCLLDEAIAEIEVKEAGRAALVDGIKAYVGPEGDKWPDCYWSELLKKIEDVLAKNKPVDNSNCHSTGCLEFISDNVSQKEKIVPKKEKPKEKEVKSAITEEEANEIVRSFVSALDSLF
jgi:hypothetical protein